MEKVNLTIRLERDLKEAVEKFAEKDDVTISQIVRAALRRYRNDAIERHTLKAVDAGKVAKQVAAVAAFTRGPGVQKGGKRKR